MPFSSKCKPKAYTAQATVRKGYAAWWESVGACWPSADIHFTHWLREYWLELFATLMLFVSPQGLSFQRARLLLFMMLSPSAFAGSRSRSGETSAANWTRVTVVWLTWRGRRREWGLLREEGMGPKVLSSKIRLRMTRSRKDGCREQIITGWLIHKNTALIHMTKKKKHWEEKMEYLGRWEQTVGIGLNTENVVIERNEMIFTDTSFYKANPQVWDFTRGCVSGCWSVWCTDIFSRARLLWQLSAGAPLT